ncbi:uncharacterized protein LOC113460394 [Zonotrichia albicollis]|uniref:uncharacterized protein LOC113460394 n=1 Tax=Zonotrichia albicollis TaxID=44394 RepID=UPI003D80F59E
MEAGRPQPYLPSAEEQMAPPGPLRGLNPLSPAPRNRSEPPAHLCTSNSPHLCWPRPSGPRPPHLCWPRPSGPRPPHLCRPRPPGPRPARAPKSRRIRARPAFCGGCSSRRVAGPSLGAVRKLGAGAASGAARSPRRSGGARTGIWARGFGSWSRRCLLRKLGRAASCSAGGESRGRTIEAGLGLGSGPASPRAGRALGLSPALPHPLRPARGWGPAGAVPLPGPPGGRRFSLEQPPDRGRQRAAHGDGPAAPSAATASPPRAPEAAHPAGRPGTSGAGAPRAEGAGPPLSLSTAPGVRAGPRSGRSSDTCRSQAVSPAFLPTLMPATVLCSNSLLGWKRTGTITAERYWQ